MKWVALELSLLWESNLLLHYSSVPVQLLTATIYKILKESRDYIDSLPWGLNI